MVIGDEWKAGNLSYHLESRPKWHEHRKCCKLSDGINVLDISFPMFAMK